MDDSANSLPFGGTLQPTAGYFNISSTVYSPYSVMWLGSGDEATVICLNPNTNITMMDFDTPSFSSPNPDSSHQGMAGLTNLKFEGNKGSQTNNKLTVIHIETYAIDFQINNVFVENASGWGVVADTMWGFKANNLIIESSLQDGFLSNGTANLSSSGSSHS